MHQRMRLPLLMTVLALLLSGSAQAARRQYTIDTDPLRQGNKALEKGQLDEARAYFEEAVANDHHLPEALLGLAQIDLRLAHYDDAEAHYRQALAAGGDTQARARAGLGLLLLRQGHGDAALAEFEQALADDPKLWEAHYGMAIGLMADEKWDDAKPHLDRGKKLKGLSQGEGLYQHGLALYLLGTGDMDGGERAALRARHLNPADPMYAELVAEIYRDRGLNALAIDAYQQLLANPSAVATAPVRHALGVLLAEENRFNEARDQYQQAVALDSTFAPAWKNLADLFRRADRPDQAAGTYVRYAALAPDDFDAQLNLSQSLHALKRYGESATAAQAALALAPNDTTAQYWFARAGIRTRDSATKAKAAAVMAALPPELAWEADDLVALAAWQTDQKDYTAATNTLGRAAAMDPARARIPLQLGLVALRQGAAETAIAHFSRAVELDPEDATNHLNRGIARYRAGDLKAAVPDFRQAVALDPDRSGARLLLAQVLAATNDIGTAEQEYRRVLEQEPANAKALRGVGFCRIRSADYQSAAASYAKAAEAEPDNADGWAGLGSARLGLGQLDRAAAAFARARAIDPNNPMLKTGTQLLNQAQNAGKDN